MPTETAADLESFFEEEEFAEAAVYLSPAPGAVPIQCSVIIDRGQGRETVKLGNSSFAGSERHLWVRRSEIETVARDGTFNPGSVVDGIFVPGAETFAVLQVPKLDHTGRLWSVDLLIKD